MSDRPDPTELEAAKCIRCGKDAAVGRWTVVFQMPGGAGRKLVEYCDDCGPRQPANGGPT